MTLYATYKQEELHHSCKNFHDNYYCSNRNILKRTNTQTCILALYKKNKQQIKKKCAIQISATTETIYQLNSTSFYVFTPTKTTLTINCREKTVEKHEIQNYLIISLEPGCRASLNKHIFSAGIEIEEGISIRTTQLHLRLTELVNIKEEDEKEFLTLLKDEQAIGNKPINIVDVKKKYELKVLSKHHNLMTNLFGSLTSIALFAIAIYILIWLYKRYRKTNKKENGNTYISAQYRMSHPPTTLEDTTNMSVNTNESTVSLGIPYQSATEV